MNPAQVNGINPALLAAYQNSQSNQSQPQFNPQPQFAPQQQPAQFQQSPSTPSKFPYNGVQPPSYPAMFNGTGQFMNSGGVGGNAMSHGSMMTPGQAVQAGLIHHGPNQMFANGRQQQHMGNIHQMNAGQIFQKPAATVNGMNPGSLPPTVGQQIPGISPAQLTQLAGMGPQERQKAMMYLQHQHQQQRMLQQQLPQQNMPQSIQQTPQSTPQQLPFDRPPSSMSTPQGMMPPPPRPPTSLSRPGTSHSHGPGQPPQNRPPSRPGTAQPMSQPGMTLPDGSPAGVMHHPQGHDHGEIPGSPSRGAKRKLSGSNLAVQTPRMGSQPLPMGVQNLPMTSMDGQTTIGDVRFPGIPMSQPQQISQQRQFPGGPRQSINGVHMMAGTPGVGMGHPPATRNQMPQMLDGTSNIVPDPFSSAGIPNLMNGLPHQVATPQLGGIGGMPPGQLNTHPGSTPAPTQMLAQTPQHPSLPGPGPSAVTSNLGVLPPTMSGLPGGSNLPQGLQDATRMSIGPTNSMTNLMNANTPIPTNKLSGSMSSIGIGRAGSISATNSMSLPPSTPGSSIPSLFPPTNQAVGTRIPSSSNVPHLNPKVTQVTVVSLAASATEIPTLSKEEIENVKQWMKADKEHEDLQRSTRDRTTEEVARIVRKVEWWEKDDQAVVPPSRSRRDKFSIGLSGARGIRRKAGQRMGIRLPRKILPEDANRPELLVPIRLELDIEHHKLRDTFVWNLNDPIITPELFAQSVVDDYSLPQSTALTITKAIQEQLSDFKAHTIESVVDDGFFGTAPVRSADEDIWWERWRNGLRTENGAVRRKKRKSSSGSGPSDPTTSYIQFESGGRPVADQNQDDGSMEEMRILIKLDIIVGSIRLEDQFEWELNNPDGSAPERFAEVYCMELGLNGDFKTAIAHCIREQVHMYQKSLFILGHPSEGLGFQDEDLRTSFLPSLNVTAARSLDQVPSFTPVLNYLSDGELERNEREREKDLARRRRKGNRGRRGMTLPDREVLKTCRTPAIGFPEVDPSTLNSTAISAPTHKRAAATAATLTITNMIASENGGAVLPPSTPLNIPATTTAPVQPKDKKPKALFKAPPVPPSVLRPRAHVHAPTSSTGIAGLNVPASAIEGMSTSAPDSRAGVRVLTTKRARELEREAREKEFVDGQHPNFIGGVWHCSNCGCPGDIAIGRRKGPLGDKSQCGTCGKYWHRHRRPRPVEYSTDPEFHLRQQAKGGNDEGNSKAPVSKKKKSQVVVDESKYEEADAPEDVREEDEIAPTTVANVAKLEAQTSSALPHPLDDRPLSPVSTASSTSEPPLAEQVKMNGGSSGYNSNPSTPAKTTREIPERPENGAEPLSEPPSALRSSGATPSTAPEWLKRATELLRAKYPGDEFDVVLRKIKPDKPADWRIRCHDCPMMVYTTGPGSTLSNFEVHLRNRKHREKVKERLGQ